MLTYKHKFVKLLKTRLKELAAINLKERDRDTKRLVIHSFEINKDLYERITGEKLKVTYDRI